MACSQMAKALAFASFVATAGAQALGDFKVATQFSEDCSDFPGYRNPTQAECETYTTLLTPAGSFQVTPKAPPLYPPGCYHEQRTTSYTFSAQAGTDTGGTRGDFYAVCLPTAPLPTATPPATALPTTAPPTPTTAARPTAAHTSGPVTCKGVSCQAKFEEICAAPFDSNNIDAKVKSPKDVLLAECPQCSGATNIDTCPTRLYDAPRSGAKWSIDKTSVASVAAPLVSVSALVAFGAIIRAARQRTSGQAASTEADAEALMQ